MKVIITGATGMVGKGVLLECLDHPEITAVLSVARRPLDLQHEKLTELIHEDFSDFRAIAQQISGYDACYACMGVSSAGMKESDFKRYTYDYTLALARTLHASSPHMTFTYVSGAGTDSTEKGKVMWARIKGKTENDLLNLGFGQAYMFRPGLIVPKRGVKPSGKVYSLLINCLSWLFPLLRKLNPDSVVDSTQVGQAMIQATIHGHSHTIIPPKDIQILAKKL
ncbi:epimerase [Reichenbachiella sp. 5M10]|uniref:NAD-dependent epimerase/dehydratase family protein n=1 Tax=Reichenbachiella sp. 5M10 TaxID=1889772 RepID=UPI000C147FB5|nr:NAD-dependent epimerase/dehydratase family protein [Reichenbachiella sp. 5M10]PIB35734.1 epimerase [Reichenbachiella sp. 5M10]